MNGKASPFQPIMAAKSGSFSAQSSIVPRVNRASSQVPPPSRERQTPAPCQSPPPAAQSAPVAGSPTMWLIGQPSQNGPLTVQPARLSPPETRKAPFVVPTRMVMPPVAITITLLQPGEDNTTGPARCLARDRAISAAAHVWLGGQWFRPCAMGDCSSAVGMYKSRHSRTDHGGILQIWRLGIRDRRVCRVPWRPDSRRSLAPWSCRPSSFRRLWRLHHLRQPR